MVSRKNNIFKFYIRGGVEAGAGQKKTAPALPKNHGSGNHAQGYPERHSVCCITINEDSYSYRQLM